MKSLLIFVSVICGVVQANPGILDFFSGPPHAHVQTVYVVKPSHDGHSHHEHRHGWKSHQPTKTIIKYVTKPSSPSSYFSSFFSKPFSSGGWSSGPSSYGKRKPGKKPSSMVVTEEEYKARLKAKEEDGRPMQQMEMLREMEAEDPNSQVEMVGNMRPSSFREMSPPRGKSRPMMMSMQGEDFGVQENDEGPTPMMMMQMVKGRSKPSSSKPSKGKSGSSSSSSGWSSGGPPTKTVTYVSSGPSSSGWGWEPSSHGWSSGGPSYYSSGGWGGDDEDEWSSFGNGWSSDGQEEEGGEEETTEAATSTTAAPPSQMVDEVGTTEEGEDRRRPSAPLRRPGTNAALTAARPTTMQGNRPRTNEPQPETPAENPRPVYGPPGQQQAQRPLGIENPVAGISTELKLGDQVISNNDGLLDEELIRTVQQIIQTFDKN